MTEPEILGPGEFYEEPRQGISPLAKLFAVGAIAVGVVALAGVVWFAYHQGIRSGAEEAAPVIRASEEPFKREPEDPGGLDVPHQDKLVFGRLAPGQITEQVERLLPPPEEPAERPEVIVEEPPARETPSTPELTPEAPTETASVPTPPSSPVAAKPQVPSVEVKPAPDPPTASEQVAPAVGEGWRIQLAAVSSQDRARSEWNRIKSQNNDLLGSLELNVQSVTLDRGTFYRIQAGPLRDRTAASGLCGQLKSRNQDCLTVAP